MMSPSFPTKASNSLSHTFSLGLTTKFLAPFAKVVCIYIHLHERIFDVQAYIRTPLTSWAVKGSTIKLIKDSCRILGTNQTVSAHTNTISLLSAGSHSQPFGVCEGPKEASKESAASFSFARKPIKSTSPDISWNLAPKLRHNVRGKAGHLPTNLPLPTPPTPPFGWCSRVFHHRRISL